MLDVVLIQTWLQKIQRPPVLPLPGTIPFVSEDFPPGATEAELAGFEARTGIVLPEDLRSWLKFSNGPNVGPGGFYGVHPTWPPCDMENMYETYEDWLTRAWIPITSDGCGNPYVMPTRFEYGHGYPVLYVGVVDGDKVPTYIAASDLEHFLTFVFERRYINWILNDPEGAYWPFEKDKVLEKDPALLGFHSVPLPWEID